MLFDVPICKIYKVIKKKKAEALNITSFQQLLFQWKVQPENYILCNSVFSKLLLQIHGQP